MAIQLSFASAVPFNPRVIFTCSRESEDTTWLCLDLFRSCLVGLVVGFRI